MPKPYSISNDFFLLMRVGRRLLKRSCELLHCEHTAVFLVDHNSRRLSSVCSERGGEAWELPLDKGILGYAARQNQLCNVRRAYDDPRFYSSTDTITGIASREVLCIPIVHELQPQYRSTSVFAVLQAWNTTHQKPFTTNDQILASLLSIHVGAILLQTKVHICFAFNGGKKPTLNSSYALVCRLASSC